MTAAPASTTDVTLRLAAGVDPSCLSEHDKAVFARLCAASGNPGLLITRANMTAEGQARVMYGNLVRYGVEEQRKLYLAPGRAVIDVFVAHEHEPAPVCIAAMAAKIVEIGPHLVSHHCADSKVLHVYDVAPASLTHQREFIGACAGEMAPGGALSKVLSDANHDPAIHLEIPQPQGAVS